MICDARSSSNQNPASGSDIRVYPLEPAKLLNKLKYVLGILLEDIKLKFEIVCSPRLGKHLTISSPSLL